MTITPRRYRSHSYFAETESTPIHMRYTDLYKGARFTSDDSLFGQYLLVLVILFIAFVVAYTEGEK